MKRIMATTLGTLLLTATMIPSMQVEAKERFTDLEGIGAKNDIMYLYEKNIIGGFEDGTFKPNQPITRAQVSSMLVKALDYELIDNPTVNFKDVTNKSGYYKVMATVSEKGILRGDNGYMRPNEPTTRGQMAAVLRRAFDLPLEKQATFVDVSPLNGFSSDINSIAKNRITGGYPDGTYKPADSVTRAQFSSFLVRALDDKMKVSSYKSYVGQKGTEIEQNGWLYTIKGSKLVKINQKTKEEVVMLSKTNFSYIDALYQVRLQDGFPIVLYNNELFIPYWSSVGEATDLPLSYGLMKTSTNEGKYEEIDLQGRKFNSGANRNVYVWNDRIYYTVEQKSTDLNQIFDETVNIDEPLDFYSVKLNGSDPKLEATINTRVIFEDVGGYIKKPTISQDNKSVKYDHSAMYYFNKKGVFKYDLINGKSTRLTSVQAKDMTVTDTGIDIVDVKGKKHTLKK
ncbi:S-layer homology domain-containing protein [Sporosarcina sp. FSL K6-2383]|uniref:S-layer homology domain-containing protein n=1 Tax=Sporosarcina sp. FSL K6-2383 TaxID=2921556 RepID=UPI003159CABF